MPMVDQTFGVADQAVFFSFIAIGGLVGIYFAYSAPKASNPEDDYLFGERKMKMVPVAFSLAASAVSGIAMVALPAEVYIYGMQVAYLHLFLWLGTVLYNTQFLPVFHGIKGLSVNKYFEKRFDKRLRLVVSALFFFSAMCFVPPVMYVPSLAYEQMTGFNKYWVTVCVCIVCIFYTSIGGLKAVVWTDAIQLLSMLTCVVVIIVKGTYDIGPSAIWERTVATQRLEPPYVDIDPTIRQTIFSVVIGGLCIRFKIGYLSQGQIQRHQSLSTISDAKKAVWIMTGLQAFFHLTSMYIGLLIFAFYFRCDPITMKVVRAKDQVVPLYIMQTIGNYPGLTGLYLSGIFSASLSTVSTILNTMAGVFVEDWIRGHTRWNPSGRQATWIMRIFVMVTGMLSVGLVFVVAQLGTLFQVTMTVESLFSGAQITIFCTGLFIPWATSLGALVGGAAAVACVAPIIIGAQYFIAKGVIRFPIKPFTTEGCSEMFNVSSDLLKNVTSFSRSAIPYGPTRGDVWSLFRISHYYFLPLSIACGLTAVALVTIFISKTDDLRNLDMRLIAPISRRWLPKRTEQSAPKLKRRIVSNEEESLHMLPFELQLFAPY